LHLESRRCIEAPDESPKQYPVLQRGVPGYASPSYPTQIKPIGDGTLEIPARQAERKKLPSFRWKDQKIKKRNSMIIPEEVVPLRHCGPQQSSLFSPTLPVTRKPFSTSTVLFLALPPALLHIVSSISSSAAHLEVAPRSLARPCFDPFFTPHSLRFTDPPYTTFGRPTSFSQYQESWNRR